LLSADHFLRSAPRGLPAGRLGAAAGVALRADALAVVMLLVVAVVIFGIGVYACADFGTPSGQREARAPFTYWLLLMAVWGSLNLVFVAATSSRCTSRWNS